jgi:mono/diheme cytochrome c family protein
MRASTRLATFALLVAVAMPAWAEEPSSLSRGGRLYDNWYRELGEKPPLQRHPAYPIGGAVAAEGAKTWRCVECHGWDYRGKDGQFGRGERYTGIKGIAGMAGAAPERVMAVLTDATHGYGEVMDRDDLLDLARFVAAGQTPLMARIDPASGRLVAEIQGTAGLYQTVCAICHGADGQSIQSIPPLGDLAREDPWQTLHNVVNGHAGGAMPSLRLLEEAQILGILAYMQGLPKREMLASVTRGGRLYGNWARETGRQAPAGPHPAWRGKVEDAAEARGTWNCRECHGWDYMGKDGASATGRHFTGIKGIRAAAGLDPAKIVAILGDETHRYGELLSRRDLLDLANFVSGGQIDMYGPIDRKTGAVAGAPERYASHYQTMCATCHGIDGRRVRTMPSLGRVVQEEPWRALHNVLNGHPGENMPPLRALPEEMVTGILAYAQRLPTRK